MRWLIALCMLLLVLPMAALARMDTLSRDDLGEVTGQVGITVDLTWQMLDSYLAWTDDDGFGNTYDSQGVLTLDDLAIDDGEDTPGPIEIVGMKFDVGSTSNGTAYLCLTLPAITGEVTIGNILIGTAPTLGGPPYSGSLGSVYLGDFNLASSVIKVSAY